MVNGSHDLLKQILVVDFLPSATCSRIIDGLYPGNEASVLTDPKNHRSEKMPEVRVTTNMYSRDTAFVKSVLRDIITQKVEPFYNNEIDYWNQPVLLKYDIGGFYQPHTDGQSWVDGEWRRIYDRDYSVITFLNSNYGGGTLSFPELGLTVQPHPGRVVAFPADHRFRHGADATTSGTRYQLVSWLTAVGTVRTNSPPVANKIFRWMS